MPSYIPNILTSIALSDESLQQIEEKKRLEQIAFDKTVQHHADEFTHTLVMKMHAECLEGKRYLNYPMSRHSMPLMFPHSHYILKEVEKRFTEENYTFEKLDGGTPAIRISW